MHFNSINASPLSLQSWTDEIDLTWLSIAFIWNFVFNSIATCKTSGQRKEANMSRKEENGKKKQKYQSTVSHVNNLRTLYPTTEYLFLTNLLSCLPTCSSQHCRYPCWDQSLRSSPWDSRRPANICILWRLKQSRAVHSEVWAGSIWTMRTWFTASYIKS